MSYNPCERIITIKTLKKNKQGVLDIINRLNVTLFDGFEIEIESNNTEVKIKLSEFGFSKGGFSGSNNYDLDEFIKRILNVDKENTLIYVKEDSELTFIDVYYYINDNFVCKTKEEYDLDSCNSKEKKINLIKKDFSYFQKLSKEEQKDFNYQMASLEARYGHEITAYGSIDYADSLYSDEFLDREETVRAIFKFGGRGNLFFKRVKDVYKNDDKLMRECLKLRPSYIGYLPFKFRNDKELVLSLIEIEKKNENPELSLIEVSNRLRNDKKVVLNFIKYRPSEFEFASDRLKSDYDLCKLYLKLEDSAIGKLKNVKNEEILNDKEIILPIFEQCYIYEEYALISDNLKNDKDILIAWLVERYRISDNYYYDNNLKEKKQQYKLELEKMDMKKLTLYAFKKETLFSIRNVGSLLLNDKDFIRECIKITGWRGDEIPLGDSLNNDKDFVLELLNKGVGVKIGNQLLNDKEFIISNFDKIYSNISFEELNNNIKNDYDIAKLFLSKYGYYIIYLNDELKDDKNLRSIALNNWHLIDWDKDASLEVFKNFIDIDKDDLRGAIDNNPILLKEIPELLIKYPDYKNKKFDTLNFFDFYGCEMKTKQLDEEYHEEYDPMDYDDSDVCEEDFIVEEIFKDDDDTFLTFFN